MPVYMFIRDLPARTPVFFILTGTSPTQTVLTPCMQRIAFHSKAFRLFHEALRPLQKASSNPLRKSITQIAKGSLAFQKGIQSQYKRQAHID